MFKISNLNSSNKLRRNFFEHNKNLILDYKLINQHNVLFLDILLDSKLLSQPRNRQHLILCVVVLGREMRLGQNKNGQVRP